MLLIAEWKIDRKTIDWSGLMLSFINNILHGLADQLLCLIRLEYGGMAYFCMFDVKHYCS